MKHNRTCRYFWQAICAIALSFQSPGLAVNSTTENFTTPTTPPPTSLTEALKRDGGGGGGGSLAAEMTAVSAFSSFALLKWSSQLERLAAVSEEKFSRYLEHADGVNELARGFYTCTLESFHLLQKERTDALHLSQRLLITQEAVKRGDRVAALRQLRHLRDRYASTRLHVEQLRANHSALAVRGQEVGHAIAADLAQVPLLESQELGMAESTAFAGTAFSALSSFMGHAALTRVALGAIVRSMAASGALGSLGFGVLSYRKAWKHKKHAASFKELGGSVLGQIGSHMNETVVYLNGLERKYDALVVSLEHGVEVALGVTLDTFATTTTTNDDDSEGDDDRKDHPLLVKNEKGGDEEGERGREEGDDEIEDGEQQQGEKGMEVEEAPFGPEEVDALFGNLLTHVESFRAAADDFIFSFSEGKKLPESLDAVLAPTGPAASSGAKGAAAGARVAVSRAKGAVSSRCAHHHHHDLECLGCYDDSGFGCFGLGEGEKEEGGDPEGLRGGLFGFGEAMGAVEGMVEDMVEGATELVEAVLIDHTIGLTAEEVIESYVINMEE